MINLSSSRVSAFNIYQQFFIVISVSTDVIVIIFVFIALSPQPNTYYDFSVDLILLVKRQFYLSLCVPNNETESIK